MIRTLVLSPNRGKNAVAGQHDILDFKSRGGAGELFQVS